MRITVVLCLVLSAGLFGCKGESSVVLEEVDSVQQTSREPARRESATQVESTTQNSAPDATPSVAVRRPGLLSLLTFGAAVIGTLSIASGEPCNSSGCLASELVEQTAQLEATALSVRREEPEVRQLARR